MTTAVKVVAYQPEWVQLFEGEKMALEPLLGALLVQTFHMGSISVPGLKAKPVIDILLAVNRITDLDQVASSFESFCYEVFGDAITEKVVTRALIKFNLFSFIIVMIFSVISVFVVIYGSM